MDDPRLSRQLRTIDEPAIADPVFLDRLFEQLVQEAGLRPARGPGRGGPRAHRTPLRRGVALRRGRPWLLALVAVVAIGGAAAIAAGAGGLLERREAIVEGVPDPCELISTATLSAIVGAPVTIDSSPGASTAARNCGYVYPPPAGTGQRNLEIAIARPADLAAEWARLQHGLGAMAIAGLGDGAAYYPSPLATPYVTLYVLHGPDVVSVGYLTEGGASPVTQGQMEDIARLIVTGL